MLVTMRYGSSGRQVEFPEGNTTVLRMRTLPALQEPSRALKASLEAPIGCAPLAELARGKRTACVVISDITRPVPNELLLNGILGVLEGYGIARDDILILIATGVHRPNLGDELVRLVGAGIAGQYRIENHYATELDQHTDLGQTSRGTRALIDRRYCEADLKITTALVEPHLMAGYSGGRKAICPGLASLETMKIMHGPGILEHPNASPGVLDGNPFHEEALEIARMAGVDFIVNMALDEARQPVGVFAGELDAAHRRACAIVSQQTRVEVEPADIVVTSSAGAPLDATFYQAIKGPVGALSAVKPGGTATSSPQTTRVVDVTLSHSMHAAPPAVRMAVRLSNLCRW